MSTPWAHILAGAAAAVCVIRIAMSDARWRVVPDLDIAVLLCLGVALSAYGASDLATSMQQAAYALVRALVAASLLWLVGLAFERVAGKRGLGFGDVKLVGAWGAWLPPFAVLHGVTIAAIASLAVIVLRSRTSKRQAMDPMVPFASALAPALWLVWLSIQITQGGP